MKFAQELVDDLTARRILDLFTAHGPFEDEVAAHEDIYRTTFSVNPFYFMWNKVDPNRSTAKYPMLALAGILRARQSHHDRV